MDNKKELINEIASRYTHEILGILKYGVADYETISCLVRSAIHEFRIEISQPTSFSDFPNSIRGTLKGEK